MQRTLASVGRAWRPRMRRGVCVASGSGSLSRSLDDLADRTGFSGVVRVDRDEEIEVVAAYGLADRAHGVAVTPDTQLAIASGTKGLTALAVVSLVEAGQLALDTTARSLLGEDLPLIGDEVTVEHLLAHRSGIGDYLDEDEDLDLTAYLLPVGVHELATTESYLRVLDGFPAKFPAGERFSYCNSGYVVLALLAERASGRSFHELVAELVCAPAGMEDTAFLRSDELPGRAAIGYLDVAGLRSNVFHIPVRGSGDGGLYTTIADVHGLWSALFAGRIVAPEWIAELVRPRSELPSESKRYGLGFWLRPSGHGVLLEGCDAGVSFRSAHDRSRGLTWTVIANTTAGAWPLARHLDEALGDR